MKSKLFFTTIALCIAVITNAQKPFKEIGKDNEVEVLTLSNGRYVEYFTNDTLRRIGSVMFNTITNRVEYFIPQDDIAYREELDRAKEVSRFMSVDPLCRTYPWYTPYQFAGNKPIVAIDMDGLEEYVIHNFYNDKEKLSLIRIYRIEDIKGVVQENNIHKDGSRVTNQKVMVAHFNADGSQYQEPTYQDELTKTQAKILKENTSIKTALTKTDGRRLGAGDAGIGDAFHDGSLIKVEGVPTISAPSFSYSPKGLAPFFQADYSAVNNTNQTAGDKTTFYNFINEEASQNPILITGTEEFRNDLTKQLIDRGISAKNILTIDKLSSDDQKKFSENSNTNGFYYIKKEEKTE